MKDFTSKLYFTKILNTPVFKILVSVTNKHPRKEGLMLPSQVNYWTLQESKRHNLATEKLTQQEVDVSKGNLMVNQQNADTNARNAEINSVNAITNRQNAATNRQNAETNRMNADINSVNALTRQSEYDLAVSNYLLQQELGRGNLALNQLVADRNYQLGQINATTAQQQAQSSAKQAAASQAQAAAAQSQARSAAALAKANVANINAKTAYQNLENDWYTVNNTAALGTKVVSNIPVLGNIAEKLTKRKK